MDAHLPDPPRATLRILLEEGLCLLALLRAGAWPRDPQAFRERLEILLAEFDARGAAAGRPRAALAEARYAFCALADETLLDGASPVREAWARAPLQLAYFGEHLAGEGFFRHLDTLRQDPASNWEVLEVYHACLLLGFTGKFRLEGSEGLAAVLERTAREVRQARGEPVPLAPHAEPAARARGGAAAPLPLWGLLSAAGLASLALFGAFHLALRAIPLP